MPSLNNSSHHFIRLYAISRGALKKSMTNEYAYKYESSCEKG
jgi:hypothetical protein